MTDKDRPNKSPERATGALREIRQVLDAATRLRSPAPASAPLGGSLPLPSIESLRRLYARPHDASTVTEEDRPRLSIAGARIETISVAASPADRLIDPLAAGQDNDRYVTFDLISPLILAAQGLSGPYAGRQEPATATLRALFEKLQLDWNMSPARRKLIRATDEAADRLRGLAAEMPHLAPLTQQIAAEAKLQARTKMPLRLRPTLLVGPPGLGKTYALSRIALAAGLPIELCSMTLMPSAFAWFGSHRTWRDASYGIIAKRLLETPTGNPIFFVDEFDKAQPASATDRHPYNPFFPLLERDTATRFTDEYLGFPIDASHISWIFSANDLSAFPQAILDRLEVVTVSAPSAQARLDICRSIYQETNAYYLNSFDLEPSQLFLEALPQGSLRGVRRAVEKAMAHASDAGRTTLIADDIEPSRRPALRVVSSKDRP